MKISECTASETRSICEGLQAFNRGAAAPTQSPEFRPLQLKAEAEDGTLLGGCLGELYLWNIAEVQVLWVREDCRGQGIGSRLLARFEQAAREAGCALIHLDTFDFQAKDFYLARGYEIFGTLEGCPAGHCRYYLRKDLACTKA